MYDINYFIEKFTKIPILSVGRIESCALGVCGGYRSEESKKLSSILKEYWVNQNISYDILCGTHPAYVYKINDGFINFSKILGNTPKERILNALKHVKNIRYLKGCVQRRKELISRREKEQLNNIQITELTNILNKQEV